MADSDAVLIAAQSGRALGQAARRAGLRPFVLDLFGDEDTLALAASHRRLPGRFGQGRPGAQAVMSGLSELADQAGGRTLGVILGSGFEGAPALMAQIARLHRLIGAAPETVSALKGPYRFASLCAELSIPHPAIRLSPEPEQSGARWLLKRIGGSGGSHIRAAASLSVPPGHYAQERLQGRAISLNFLADGRDIAVLARTAQWSSASPMRPFRFAGALAPGRNEPDTLPKPMSDAVTEAITRLVIATGLRGIASADLLVDGDDWWLLEINPRPGATLDVLDRRPTPLLSSHIEASLGRLPRLDPAPDDAAGSEICYAARRYACMRTLDWPDFSRDRPGAGTRVAKNAPLCTVTATGRVVQDVKNTLRERVRMIDALLDDREEYHDDRYQEPERQRSGDAARGTARR